MVCSGCEGAHVQVERVGKVELWRAQVVRVRMRRLRGWARVEGGVPRL